MPQFPGKHYRDPKPSTRVVIARRTRAKLQQLFLFGSARDFVADRKDDDPNGFHEIAHSLEIGRRVICGCRINIGGSHAHCHLTFSGILYVRFCFTRRRDRTFLAGYAAIGHDDGDLEDPLFIEVVRSVGEVTAKFAPPVGRERLGTPERPNVHARPVREGHLVDPIPSDRMHCWN